MKYIIASLLILHGLTIQAQQKSHVKQFTINIWDADYSAAYTRLYTVTNDSIAVKGIGGLVNEGTKLLLRRPLTLNEQKMILSFFNTVNIDTLKNEYANPLVDDGEQLKVQLTLYGHPAKTVVLQNYYQANLNHLFNLVNRLLLPGLAISCRSKD